VLGCVPRGAVRTRSASSKKSLRPAGSSIIAVVGADGALASNTFISGKACAFAGAAVAKALVGALRPGMEIV